MNGIEFDPYQLPDTNKIIIIIWCNCGLDNGRKDGKTKKSTDNIAEWTGRSSTETQILTHNRDI